MSKAVSWRCCFCKATRETQERMQTHVIEKHGALISRKHAEGRAAKKKAKPK